MTHAYVTDRQQPNACAHSKCSSGVAHFRHAAMEWRLLSADLWGADLADRSRHRTSTTFKRPRKAMRFCSSVVTRQHGMGLARCCVVHSPDTSTAVAYCNLQCACCSFPLLTIAASCAVTYCNGISRAFSPTKWWGTSLWECCCCYCPRMGLEQPDFK